MNKDGYLAKSSIFLILASLLVVSPGLGGEPADCEDMREYLDCESTKLADIVFVIDTTGSMGGTIGAMQALALDFADALDASVIDWNLGLTDYRDYPTGSCGSSGDWAYDVYGLTDDKDEFDGWIAGLYAWGGADWDEAVLAAMIHTTTDTDWRGGEAQKIAILMCDAPPHPDGHYCNVEGATYASMMSTLNSNGVKVYVVSASYTELQNIASGTGGTWYPLSVGDISDILDEIVAEISCSFDLEAYAECSGGELTVCAQMIGKDGVVIPYLAGETEVSMYYECGIASYGPVDLEFDGVDSYCATVPVDLGICDIIDVTVTGRVCEWTNTEETTVECPACEATAPDVCVCEGTPIEEIEDLILEMGAYCGDDCDVEPVIDLSGVDPAAPGEYAYMVVCEGISYSEAEGTVSVMPLYKIFDIEGDLKMTRGNIGPSWWPTTPKEIAGGTVTATIVDEMLVVTFDMAGTGYYLDKTQVLATTTPPPCNPMKEPGLVIDDVPDGAEAWTMTVPLPEGLDCGDDLYISAHVTTTSGESGWGDFGGCDCQGDIGTPCMVDMVDCDCDCF